MLQALTEHCLNSALSQLQSVRTMAMTNCLFLLKYSQEPPAGKVLTAALSHSRHCVHYIGFHYWQVMCHCLLATMQVY